MGRPDALLPQRHAARPGCDSSRPWLALIVSLAGLGLVTLTGTAHAQSDAVAGTGAAAAGLAPVTTTAARSTAASARPVAPVISRTTVAAAPAVGDKVLPMLPYGMNETVVRVPVGTTGRTMETTLFRPDGAGPFPVVVFNHGKDLGDPRAQPRSRPVSFAREFVEWGYLVVVPNREGFAKSDGTYTEGLCAIDEIGRQQAVDIAATVAWLHTQPDADTSRILIAGASQGGLATLAYGMKPDRGVRGLLNFAGGLRQEACGPWEQALIDAFSDYGKHSRLPSLWLYGDNDRNWSMPLPHELLDVYKAGGGNARMMDYGDYKDNAHRLVGDRDGVPLWRPAVESFLASIGMPTRMLALPHAQDIPPPSGFAPIDSVESVPYLDQNGRTGYRMFLQQYPSRAFALSTTGAWSWAEGGDNPESVALESCQRHSAVACQLYAVNDAVVWSGRTP